MLKTSKLVTVFNYRALSKIWKLKNLDAGWVKDFLKTLKLQLIVWIVTTNCVDLTFNMVIQIVDELKQNYMLKINWVWLLPEA